MERFQTIDQPATVGPQQRCHVRNGADVEQITGSSIASGLLRRSAKAWARNKRQANASQTSIGRNPGWLETNQRLSSGHAAPESHSDP